MSVIQALLLAALLFLMLLYAKSFRNQAFKRIFSIIVFALGIIFIVSPDLTNDIAHAIGIGRGADLLLYFSVIAGLLVAILVHARFRKMDRMITLLARRQALLDARKPDSTPETVPKGDKDAGACGS
jgi:small membrane protein